MHLLIPRLNSYFTGKNNGKTITPNTTIFHLQLFPKDKPSVISLKRYVPKHLMSGILSNINVRIANIFFVLNNSRNVNYFDVDQYVCRN